MQWQFDGYNYLVRLDKGEQLVARLTEFAAQQQVRGGWVSAVGGATAAELGFYELDKKQYTWHKLEQLLEIVSLSGTLAWASNQPILHLHGALSDQNMKTYGGHIKELEVGGTCEIFLHIWNKSQLSRSHSEDIGLNLLDL